MVIGVLVMVMVLISRLFSIRVMVGIMNWESVWLVNVIIKGFIIRFLFNVFINFVEFVMVLLIINIIFSNKVIFVRYNIVFKLLV